MKKQIILLLLVAMLACLLAAPVAADVTLVMTVSTSKTSVSAGDVITVTVSISETDNCSSVGLGIQYDVNAFEMVENSFDPLVAHTQASCKYNAAAKGYVASIMLESTQKVSGALFTFQLKVKEGVAIGASYEISGKTSIRVGGTTSSCGINKATVKIVCAHKYDNDCDTACNACGEKREIQHKYDGGKVTTAATCAKEGVKTYTCTICGAKKTEAVAKTTHVYDSGKVTTPATCTADGVKTYTCTGVGCGHQKTEVIPKVGHNFDDGKVTTPATCTTNGVKTFSCKDSGCTEKYTEVIPKTGHKHDSGKVTTPATCTTDGVKTYSCTNAGCNDQYTESIPKTGHKHDSGKVTTPATCTTDGVKTYSCTNSGCTDQYTEVIPQTGHNYDGGKVTTEPSCAKEGVKTFTCNTCGATRTEKIAKPNHISDEGNVTIPPDCTQSGVKTFACVNCGAVLASETLKPVGHEYESQITQEPTCQEEGVETFTCNNCGDVYTQPIAKIDHVYSHECDPDCDACEELRVVEHIYNQRFSFDETGHWHECGTCGDVLELIPHTPGPEATEEEDQICLECGFVIQPAGVHIHELAGDWINDENEHWHLCGCGEILGKEPHTWTLSHVDEEAGVETYTCLHCGLTKEEELPQQTEPSVQPTEPSEEPTDPSETEPGPSGTEPDDNKPGQNQQKFPWWIVFLSVGVLLLSAVLFIIIGIAKSKRQVGKYSA